jgi:TIR domain-containing protein
MPRIFISYRRDDTEEVAGRLYDALKARFGRSNVFRDVYALRPGEEFAKAIDQVIADADVVLVLIGRHWLAGDDDSSSPRLQETTDLLRREITNALSRGKWDSCARSRGGNAEGD